MTESDNEEDEVTMDERVSTPEFHVEDEEEYEDLYGDVNVTHILQYVHITNVDQGGAQDLGLQYEDGHVTLTASQKTNDPNQSSYVSSDFTRKLLNLEDVHPTKNTLASMMDPTA